MVGHKCDCCAICCGLYYASLSGRTKDFMVGHKCDCCAICCGLYYASLSGRTKDGEIGRKGGGPSCNTAQGGICKTPPPAHTSYCKDRLGDTE